MVGHRHDVASPVPGQRPVGNTPAERPAAFPTGALTVRRALQRQTRRHGCDQNAPCGRKRGADCPARHSGGLVIVEPKSRAGRRVVSLPSPVARALLDHKGMQAEERTHTANLWHEQGCVFAQPARSYRSARGLRRVERAAGRRWRARGPATRRPADRSDVPARAGRLIPHRDGSYGLVQGRHGEALHARPGRTPAPHRGSGGGLLWADQDNSH